MENRKIFFAFMLFFLIFSPGVSGMEDKRKADDTSLPNKTPARKRQRLAKKRFYRLVHDALLQSDLDAVGHQLSRGAHLDITYGKLPLAQLAVIRFLGRGDFASLLFMIESGANINCLSDTGETIFGRALADADYGKTFFCDYNEGRTWLNFYKLNQKIVAEQQQWKALLQRAYPHLYELLAETVRNASGTDPINTAAIGCEFVNWLLEHGAHPVIPATSTCLTTISILSYPTQKAMILWFFMNGGRIAGDLNNYPQIFTFIASHPMRRALLLADDQQAIELIDQLVQDGSCDLLCEALRLACGQARIAVVEALLNRVADQHAIQDGFIAAAGIGNLELVRLLLPALDTDDSAFGRVIERAFLRAVAQGHVDVVDYILASALLAPELGSNALYQAIVRAARLEHMLVLKLLRRVLAGWLSDDRLCAAFNQALYEATIGGHAAVFDYILFQDRVYFNFSLDLNRAGLHVTRALRDLRLNRELRTWYGRARKRLLQHIILRRNTRLLLQQNSDHNLLRSLPVELQQQVMYQAQPEADFTARMARRIFAPQTAIGGSSGVLP